MHNYPRAAVERMMKVQEVILRAMAKKITWWQAAEILGLSDRQMRRLHGRYREHGYEGALDRRVGQPSPKRVPLAVVEQVLALYQEKYFDLNVRHFHEKLREAASDSAELYVGEESVARSGVGTSGTEARSASAAAGAAAFAGDSAAHRWQAAPVVSGPPLVRFAGDSGRCHQRYLLRATGPGQSPGRCPGLASGKGRGHA